MPDSNLKRIAVIIPCFNVQETIKRVIDTIPDFVEKIIAVDDCSKDNTLSKLEKIQSPRVVVIHHQKNMGVGGAMLTGYQKALELGMEIFVKMDGDGQMKPEFLESLLEPLLQNKADFAKGNRFYDFRTIERMPFIRRIGNAGLSFWAKLVSGYWTIFDITNGYTALTVECFRKLDTRKIAKRYFFETSMLIELNIVNACVADVEMPSVYENEKSHLNPFSTLFSFPFLMVKGFFRRFFVRYVLRDFNVLSLCILIGLPLFLFGVSYGLNLWLHPPRIGEPTPAGTVMLAALPIIMGFQLLLTGLILDVVFVPFKKK